MQIHFIEGYIQQIYLVEYPDKLLLLDGCTRADVDIVCHFICKELSRPITDLKLIIVTHMHPDHAGGAHLLRTRSGAKIATAKVAGHWYSGLDGILMHWSDMILALWVAGRKKKARKNLWYSRKLDADYYLADQERLPDFNEWQAIYTQGHTDRDLSIYHETTQRLYVADLFVKVRGQFIPPYPIFYPNRYRRSLQRIRKLKPASIILAHQGEIPFTDIDFDRLDQLAPQIPVTHWRSVKAKTKKALGLHQSLPPK
ncbi:MBL fold metallo-hydrolase [Pseudoalteromonas luteoviolacea]|uniref:MBL fold metallo-hydrolase n=1 Tax=Pseudoalteromonas luteoviolacea TaxID=43657 RepID=UPI001B38B9AC|nr:MBL fold metallo-hydrolase [Pseudoalteromonas luteoviolacea]MBQ4838966.1 MBL fold metallo-hydrolase [Pseudoalteromonas luteoviolacea]